MPVSDLGFAVTSSSHRVRRTFAFIDLCGFTEFGSDRYQERADAESWEAFTDFLAEQLG